MLGRIIRVLIGFVLACLAAGATLVFFIYTPAELASLPSDIARDRMSEGGVFALAVATHTASFAALPTLIGVVFAEVRKIASWTFYVLVGVAIAVMGFLAQHFSEAPEQASILNNYALTAFLTAGFVGGLVYWLISGRFVAKQKSPLKPDAGRPASPAPPAGGTPPQAVPNRP